MMHGTFTYVGVAFDRQFNSFIAYLAHQISTQSIPCKGKCNPSMLKELSETPRTISSIDFSTKLTRTFSEKPVPEWAEVVNDGDYPKDMFVNFGCLVSTVCNVLLPEFISDRLMKVMAFNLLSAESADFVYNKYNP